MIVSVWIISNAEPRSDSWRVSKEETQTTTKTTTGRWTEENTTKKKGQVKGQKYKNTNIDSDEFIRIISVIFSSPVGSLCHTHGGVRRLSVVVRRVSSVSTITTRNN